MNTISATFITEYIKIRKAKIFWITILIFLIIPLIIGLMMFVARNPEMAAKLGMVGTKATLFGRNDWAGYLELLNQSFAGIGLIGFGFVTSWVFGREFTEHTLKNMLALPVSRTSIVIAKFLVIFFWCILLIMVIYAVGILAGILVHIPSWSIQLFYKFSYKYFIISMLTLMLCTPVAFFASYGKGLIAPIGFTILTMVMAQFLSLIGLGPYFPWAIPGLYMVAADTQGMVINSFSYMIFILTVVMGFIGTIYWWRLADHHH